MPTPYDVAVNTDPIWDAWMSNYEPRRVDAEGRYRLNRTATDQDYQAALAALQSRGLEAARGIDTSMLARGVYNSGETTRRRGDLTTELAGARDTADRGYLSRVGELDASRASTLSALEAEREMQVAESRERVARAARDEEDRIAAEAANAGTTETAGTATGGAAWSGPPSSTRGTQYGGGITPNPVGGPGGSWRPPPRTSPNPVSGPGGGGGALRPRTTPSQRPILPRRGLQ